MDWRICVTSLIRKSKQITRREASKKRRFPSGRFLGGEPSCIRGKMTKTLRFYYRHPALVSVDSIRAHETKFMNTSKLHEDNMQVRLAQFGFGRILLHLACACHDHKYRWHWKGVRRELFG
jgi:hypothetical protein